MVTKLDRLARSSRDLHNTVHELDGLSVGFVSLGESWCDTTTDAGRLILTIMGGIADDVSPTEGAVSVGSGMYHVVSVPLQLGDATVGSLELGTALDSRYARELAELSRGDAAILSRGAVLASTVSGPAARDLAELHEWDTSAARTVTLAGESWAIQPLSQLGDVSFIALASIDRAAGGQTQAALRGLCYDQQDTGFT